ncbi:MAG: hypothetical protein JNK15_04020 [Planctomycetes bacterium]|nr:hypothetical protein [Planctomycetota bacterium]
MQARMRWLTFVAFLFALISPLAAQDGTLTLTAAFEPATAKPGDKVVLVLSCDVTEGWHAYGTLEKTNLPVGLAPENVKTAGLELDGAAQVPPGMRKMVGSLATFPLPNQFRVKQPMTVPAGMAAGEITVTGDLDYNICNEHGCLPPDKVAFSAKLVVAAAAGEQPPMPTTTKPGLEIAPGDKVTIAAKFDPATARAGEIAKLVLTVTVHDHEWHAYGSLETEQLPVALPPDNVDAGPLERVGDADVPPGEPVQKGGKTTHPLPPVFEVTQVFRVPSGTKPGTIDVSGALAYQICNANVCESPAQLDFEAKLAVEAGEPRADRLGTAVAPPKTVEKKPADPKQPAQNPSTNGAETKEPENPYLNWWVLIVACIGGAFFALAMPCTYPMIPITFSFFTKQAEKRGGNVMSLALTYGAGIVVMFVLVGVLLATAIQDIASHWLTNGVIGVVFLLFSFSLFGWITLQPPQFVQNLATKASTTGGYLGVFFMGATLVITSFTCTAPIVGAILPGIAELGYARVAVGMGVFGFTMAAPFVALSLMPTKVKALPRSGEWMETLKVSLGFLELAATLKFVSNVDLALDWQAMPRELFLLLIVAIFLMWAAYLFGILRKAGTANEGVGNGRMATGITVVLAATYLLFGAMGYKLDYYMTAFAPPYSAPMVATQSHASGASEKNPTTHTIVKDDGDRALEVAKAEGKLVLYNFTGFV